METIDILPKETLTLNNGSGVVEFYHGEYVVGGFDARYLGDVFHQYREVSAELFRQIKAAKEKDGDQAAWAVYHKATS